MLPPKAEIAVGWDINGFRWHSSPCSILTVWVTGVDGFPLKLMLPPSVMVLPPSTKAPAAEIERDASQPRSSKGRWCSPAVTEPAKVNGTGETKGTLQLPLVLQLLFPPPPVQVAAVPPVTLV